jgi:transposase
MKLHRNAALSWRGRRQLAERIVVEGWTLKAAAEAAGVSVRCARKWAGRYRLEGEAGLFDRSSAPRRVANRIPVERVEAIVALRKLRMTAAEIAETLQMALSTVSGILRRLGLGKLGRLGLEQPLRYERSRPGELVHVDVKRLGRIQGGAGKRVRGGLRKHWNRSRTDAEGRRRLTVGWESCTSRSTITRGSLTPRCCRTRRRRRRSASCAGRAPSTVATGSRSSGC